MKDRRMDYRQIPFSAFLIESAPAPGSFPVFVPLFSTSSELFFAGVATVALGSATTFLWAFLGVRMQSWHQIHYRAINAVLSLFLLYCAYGMARS